MMAEDLEEDYSRSCTPESLASGVINNDLFYSDEDEEDLDEDIEHVIAEDLERLTDTGSSVNRLEMSLLQARKEYEKVKRESQLKLQQLRTRLKSSIDKTETYVKCWRKVKEFQQQAHAATLKFERAHSEYESAKETLRIAEMSIAELEQEEEERESRDKRDSPAIAIDQAWQETLANATLRVQKASKQRLESQKEHQIATSEFEVVQKECHALEQKLKRPIRKSKPYYEERFRCNQKLISIKKRIQVLQQTIDEHKVIYKKTMKHLESLSGLMHEERIRKRTNSCLMVANSEPDLVGQRSLTPDFTLSATSDNRLTFTPDYRRRNDELKNVRVTPCTVSLSNQSVPLVTISDVSGHALPNDSHDDIKEVVTSCLTRALASLDREEEEKSSLSNHVIPLVRNCPSIREEESCQHSLILQESAKELVTVTLSRALKHYSNELDTHGNSSDSRQVM